MEERDEVVKYKDMIENDAFILVCCSYAIDMCQKGKEKEEKAASPLKC